jgi:hypothetical protein
MSDYRNTDGEPATHTTTIIEKRGSGGTALIAIVLLLAVLIGGWYLYTTGNAKSSKDTAIAGAADSVSKTADKAGAALDNTH